MNKKHYLYLVVLTSSLLLSQCQSSPIPSENIKVAYPVATQLYYSPGYPEPVAKITNTAFEAFDIANKEARKWNSEAILYSIPSTFLMELNLGYSGIGSGWFFMFKVPDHPVEYYIWVDNGMVGGVTEAQPIVVGKRTIDYYPLPQLSEMIDSDKLLEIFNSSTKGKYFAENPQAILNPQLNYTSEYAFPLWSVYDVKKGVSGESLLDVNALTGEIIIRR